MCQSTSCSTCRKYPHPIIMRRSPACTHTYTYPPHNLTASRFPLQQKAQPGTAAALTSPQSSTLCQKANAASAYRRSRGMARCILLEVSYLPLVHPSLSFSSSSLSLCVDHWLLTLGIRAGTFGGMIKGMFGFGGKKGASGKGELWLMRDADVSFLTTSLLWYEIHTGRAMNSDEEWPVRKQASSHAYAEKGKHGIATTITRLNGSSMSSPEADWPMHIYTLYTQYLPKRMNQSKREQNN
jgi:hypothetical protein